MTKILKRTPCEVFSRVVGYMRPVSNWNEAKQAEFKDRKTFKIKTDEICQPQQNKNGNKVSRGKEK